MVLVVFAIGNAVLVVAAPISVRVAENAEQRLCPTEIALLRSLLFVQAEKRQGATALAIANWPVPHWQA